MNRAERSIDLRDHLPLAVVIVWLAIVGGAIWQHVLASDQPLLFDAIGYWLKARNLWAEVLQGNFVNPLNIEPTIRPPGTVLMSYPFGFEESTKGFLFRSVFLGIALTVAAVVVVARILPQTGSGRWNVACIALYVAAMPMFYHFEWTSESPGYWGLTDCFLAGVAALACSASVLGAARASHGWTFIAALLASLAFLVKPSGVLIIATIALGWVLIALAHGWPGRPSLGVLLARWKTVAIGMGIFFSVCAPVLVVGLRSKYFSPENVAFGNRALRVMSESWLAVTPEVLRSVVHTSFGYPLVIALLVVLLGLLRMRLGVLVATRVDSGVVMAGLLAATVSLSAGLWFWLVKTGGSQFRYFYPFALMATIYVMPLALITLGTLSERTQKVFRALLLLAPLNIAFILAQSDPPVGWQRLTGVNVAAAKSTKDEMVLARRLLAITREAKRNVTLYATSTGDTPVVESFWQKEALAHPELGGIQVKRPLDWERPTAFRLGEIDAAEFILLRPVRDPAEYQRLLTMRSVDNFVAEQRLFEAWFSGLGANEGIEVFGETERLRLLRVVDPERFARALHDLKRSREWRPEFIAANPQSWWSRDEISARLAGRRVVANGVAFDGLFRIEALTLERDGDIARIDFWWSKDQTPAPGEWYFFAHLVDASGEILANVGIRLQDRAHHTAGRPFRFDSLAVPLTVRGAPMAIAFGIYRAKGGRPHPLIADSGRRDWDNHRVLVPLP